MSVGRGGIGQRRDRTKDRYFAWDGESRDELGNIILKTEHIYKGRVERTERVILQGTAGEPYQRGDKFRINRKVFSGNGIHFCGANDYLSKVSTQQLEERRELNKPVIDLILLEEGTQSGWIARQGSGQGLLVGRWQDKRQVILEEGQRVVYEGRMGNKNVISYHSSDLENPRVLVSPKSATIDATYALHPMGRSRGLIHSGLQGFSEAVILDSMMLRTNIVESSDIPWSDLSQPLELDGKVDPRLHLTVTDRARGSQTLVVMDKGKAMDVFTSKGFQEYIRGTELDGKEVHLITTGKSPCAPEIVFNQMVQPVLNGIPQQAYMGAFPRRENVTFAHTFMKLMNGEDSLEKQTAQRIVRAMLK